MSEQSLDKALRTAIGQHGAWKLKLKTAVTVGRATMPSHQAADAGCCEFGRWLSAPEQVAALGNSVQHKVISRLHTEFHACAGRIIAAIEQGDTVQAARLLDQEFTPQSDHLVAGLTKWSREAMARIS